MMKHLLAVIVTICGLLGVAPAAAVEIAAGDRYEVTTSFNGQTLAFNFCAGTVERGDTFSGWSQTKLTETGLGDVLSVSQLLELHRQVNDSAREGGAGNLNIIQPGQTYYWWCPDTVEVAQYDTLREAGLIVKIFGSPENFALITSRILGQLPDLADLKAQINGVNGSVTSLRATVDENRTAVDGALQGMNRRLNRVGEQASAAEASAATAEKAVAGLGDALADHADTIEALRARVDSLETRLVDRVNAAVTAALSNSSTGSTEASAQAIVDTVVAEVVNRIKSDQNLRNELLSNTVSAEEFDNRLTRLVVDAVEAQTAEDKPSLIRQLLWFGTIVVISLVLVITLPKWVAKVADRRVEIALETDGAITEVVEKIRLDVKWVKRNVDHANELAAQALMTSTVALNLNLPEGWRLIGDLPTQNELDNLNAGESVDLTLGKFDEQGAQSEKRTVRFTKQDGVFVRDGNQIPGLVVEGIKDQKRPIAVRPTNLIAKVRNALQANKLTGIDEGADASASAESELA